MGGWLSYGYVSRFYPALLFCWFCAGTPTLPTIEYCGKSGLTDLLLMSVCFSILNAPNRMSLASPVAEISEARDADPPVLAWTRGCPRILYQLLDVRKGSNLQQAASDVLPEWFGGGPELGIGRGGCSEG